MGDGFSQPTRALHSEEFVYVSLKELDKTGPKMPKYFCDIQSTEQLMDETSNENDSQKQQQILEFEDGAKQTSLDLSTPSITRVFDKSHNDQLSNFLSRPTKIHEFTWVEGTAITLTDIYPWLLYFDNAVIKRKLDNYAYMKCDLKIKIVINASPFYYGALLFSYLPMPVIVPNHIYTTVAGLEFIPLTQRPHVYAYPQNCQGGTMTLPFIWNGQWLPTTASGLTDMGLLQYASFDILENANSVVGASVDVSIYAWAENVELAGPTQVLSVQSKEKDEYSHEGTISKPSSAIARYTGMLSKIPIIGPFATATSMVSQSVSDVARLFGYTNVPVIDDVHYFKNTSLPHLASTDIGHPIDKLTIDAKNELSIDTRLCGDCLGDNMDIAKYVSRETWIYTFFWFSTKVPGDLLFNARVYGTPTRRVPIGTVGDEYYTTPLSHIGAMFRYWRGDMIFRFKILCTQYHKGRLQISWAPTGQTGAAVDTNNQIYTKIVDISKSTDVEFRVPYIQDTAYLKTASFDPSLFYNVTPLTEATDGTTNGILSVKVLNRQTAPSSSATIQVLAYVRAADNFEFAGPKDIPRDLSAYYIQSKETDYDEDLETSLLGTKINSTDPAINLIYHGETVKSLRSLLNRYTYFSRVLPITNDSTLYMTGRCVMSRTPLYPGFDPNGVHKCVEPISATPGPYNFVNWSPITWLQLAFLGSRGSINWSAIPASSDNHLISIKREVTTRTALLFDNIRSITRNTDANAIAREVTVVYPNGVSGYGATQPDTQSCVSISAPLYSRYKFIGNSTDYRTLGDPVDESDSDTVVVTYEPNSSSVTNSIPGVDLYVSAGADFSLVYFINSPVIYKLDAYPTSSP